jgi:DNA-binding NarL/FixJ family response regulator
MRRDPDAAGDARATGQLVSRVRNDARAVSPRLRILVLDSHSIYRGGLAACLCAMPEVESVSEAGSVAEGSGDGVLGETDLVIVDDDLPGAHEFIHSVREQTAARVLVCSSRGSEQDVLAATHAGAVGYLRKDTLTPDALAAGVRAATDRGVVSPLEATLRDQVSRVARKVADPRSASRSRLTAREQEVLRLVAEGHPTREVARRLSYSERTIKNIIHEVVTKLNARTRSQAVAEAVRAGLI